MKHQSSHPRTYELMSFGYSFGFITMPFKHRFNRARPSQLSPSLQPMFTVPGHPAYPSGHGFQSWFVALTLSELRPDAREALLAMAQRIGVNREIAGVHYPSDTKAGQSLAEQAFAIAKTGKLFQEHLAEAKANGDSSAGVTSAKSHTPAVVMVAAVASIAIVKWCSRIFMDGFLSKMPSVVRAPLVSATVSNFASSRGETS